MNMRIRKCRAGDAAFLAESILIAGRAHVKKGIWEIVLGITEEACLRFLEHLTVTEIPHLFHYTCSFIAEDDRARPLGSLGGYDPKKRGYQALQVALPEVYKKLNMSREAFQDSNERASKLLACLPREIENAWVIDSVATKPEYRDRGVAQRLLQTVMAEGKKLGYPMVQVNMYIGNEPALRLYQKLGFAITEEVQDPYFEKKVGAPGMLSLARKV